MCSRSFPALTAAVKAAKDALGGNWGLGRQPEPQLGGLARFPSPVPSPQSPLDSADDSNVVFLFVLVARSDSSRTTRNDSFDTSAPVTTSTALDHPWTRLRNVVVIGIGQSKILRDPFAGILHASVFWGFVVLTLGSGEILVRGVFPGVRLRARSCRRRCTDSSSLSQELFAGLVLAAVAVLLYRRLVIKPKRLQGDKVHSGDAVFILSMIAALMVTLFVTATFERVVGGAALDGVPADLQRARR